MFVWKSNSIRFGFGANKSQFPFKGGVAHSDELIYLFPYPPQAANLNANDTEIAKNLVELWTSFVVHGVPHLKSNQHFVWPSMTSNFFQKKIDFFFLMSKIVGMIFFSSEFRTIFAYQQRVFRWWWFHRWIHIHQRFRLIVFLKHENSAWWQTSTENRLKLIIYFDVFQ